MVIGISFSNYANFDFIFYCKMQMLIAAIVFIGFWTIIYTCLKMLYARLDRLTQGAYRKYSGILKKVDDNFFTFCIIVLLIFWLVQMLPFFPGSVPHDMRKQLHQFFEFYHLIFSTLMRQP